jgi:thioesterase domain-containing protein
LIGAADEAEVGGLANVLALYARQVAAAQGFRARKVHFPVALFVARQAPRSLQQKQRARWRWLARGSWSERSVPGSHHTLLLAPNVQTNARAVADYLNALDGARGKGMHRNPLSGAARPHLPLSGRAGR